jgi:DNA-binding MarR family transcriptional regulator
MLRKRRFTALSEFRHELTRFHRFSEDAARSAGVTPAQYLLLLHLRGYPGRDWATIGDLAARLQASHQSTVALVQRCERKGWLGKKRSPEDARCVRVTLKAAGSAKVERIAALHRDELDRLAGVLDAARASGIRPNRAKVLPAHHA